MFCDNCGKEIGENQKYCSFCGAENHGYKMGNSSKRSRDAKNVVEKKVGKAVKTKVIAGIVGGAVLVGGTFAGYKGYSHFVGEKTPKKITSKSEITKSAKKEKTAEVEKFTLEDDQITDIEEAAKLYDELKRNEGLDVRKDYSLSLEGKEIPTDILENVMAGLVCSDESVGNIIQENEVGERTEALDIEKGKELLEDTFGYTVKSDNDLQNIFTVDENNELNFKHISPEAMEKNYIRVRYNAKRFAQTAEDTYHFYIYVSSEYQSGQPYADEGWMDITAHKNAKSLFGGFVFDKIDFKLNPSGTTDYERMINDIVNCKEENEGDTGSNILGVYDVNTLTDEEFERYAKKFIADADGCNEDRMVIPGSTDTRYTLSRDTYEDICKNTLGRKKRDDKDENIDQISVSTDGLSMWLDNIECRLFQSLDGTVKVEGTIKNLKSDKDTEYIFTADGYANEASKMGMVIEKVEVTEDPTTAWKDAYINWVENSNRNATYELIDVNGDEISELVRIGANMAEGETVATYANGGVQEVQIYRMGIKYIPGGNVLDNSSGSMGEYYDQIYKIEDGNWVQIANGKYGLEDNTVPPEYDEDGNLICDFYEWNGNSVTEDEYENYVNTIFGSANIEEVSEQGADEVRIIQLIKAY